MADKGGAGSAAGGAGGGGAGGPALPQKRGGGMLWTIVTFGFLFLVLTNSGMRNLMGKYTGYLMDPIIGFGGEYPVLTVMLAGTIMVILTTVLRHFTTDWIEMAKFQAHMRAFNKEFFAARKENNTYKMKKLQDQQPEMQQRQAQISAQQMKTMPVTMLVVIPLFAWVATFLQDLDYSWFTAPWNHHVDLFDNNGILPFGGPEGHSLFPHWILLYTTLSIPLGSLIQKGMKVLSWKERWKKLHEAP